MKNCIRSTGTIIAFLYFTFTLSATDLYWTTEDGAIFGSDIDGGNVQEIFDGAGMSGDAVDVAVSGDFLYWTDNAAPGAIWRAERDGTGAAAFIEGGVFHPQLMAIDEENGFIYFSAYNDGIFRADLETGENLATVVDAFDTDTPTGPYTGVALEDEDNLFFLTLDGALYRAQFIQEDWAYHSSVSGFPGGEQTYGLAYDAESETVYYTEFQGNALRSFNLDTEEDERLRGGLTDALGVKLSPSGTHLLIGQREIGVSAFQLDNFGYEVLVETTDAHFGVAVEADPDELPPGDVPGEHEPIQAPFTLDFGTGEGQTGLGPLLIPERFEDWSTQEDSIRFASQAGTWTDTAAVADVSNYEQGEDFYLETEVTMVEMGRDWFSGSDNGWQRFGFAVLGGPHTDEDPFSQNSVGYKLLMMRGQLRLNDHGEGIITRENWYGAFENGAVYRLEATGVFDESGRLVLTFRVTDHNGYSQTISTDPIENPHQGNVFGFFGRDRYEEGAPPAYDYDFLTMKLEAPELHPPPAEDGDILFAADFEDDELNEEPATTNVGGDWVSRRSPATGTMRVVEDTENVFGFGTDNRFLQVESANDLRLVGNFAQGAPVATVAFDFIGRVLDGDGNRWLNPHIRVGGSRAGLPSLRMWDATIRTWDEDHDSWPTPQGYTGPINPSYGENDSPIRVNTIVNNHPDETISYTGPDGEEYDLSAEHSSVWIFDYSSQTWSHLLPEYTFARQEGADGGLIDNLYFQLDGGDPLRSFDMDNVRVLAGAFVDGPDELVPGDGFAAWQEEVFGADSGEPFAAPGADASGDGILNAVAYALDIDPLTSNRDHSNLPVRGIVEVGGEGGAYLSLSYIRPEGGRDDVVYTVESGGEPGEWGAADFERLEDLGGGFERVVYRDTVPIGDEGRRFMRLHIELQE